MREGAAAGLAATAAMSAFMWGAQRAGFVGEQAPKLVMRRSLEAVGEHPSGCRLRAISFVAHFVFGAAAGAAYGALSERLPSGRSTVSGGRIRPRHLGGNVQGRLPAAAPHAAARAGSARSGRHDDPRARRLRRRPRRSISPSREFLPSAIQGQTGPVGAVLARSCAALVTRDGGPPQLRNGAGSTSASRSRRCASSGLSRRRHPGRSPGARASLAPRCSPARRRSPEPALLRGVVGLLGDRHQPPPEGRRLPGGGLRDEDAVDPLDLVEDLVARRRPARLERAGGVLRCCARAWISRETAITRPSWLWGAVTARTVAISSLVISIGPPGRRC